MQVFLGLGANLSDPAGQVLTAIQALSDHPHCQLISASRLYASKPMGPQDQPDYINAVVEIETTLSPLALLDLCQAIEQQQHRVRVEHWGSRTLDIDILCYGTQMIDEPRLTIPHVGIAERDFVLLPWRDIAPNFVIPQLGRVADLCDHVTSYSAVPIE
jgi:2-amino-4-hydroxy-6-hydroxymethyldihydropteridine diphosphokinase